MSWFDSLANSTLKNAISATVADNSVTYNETLSLLQAAATGGITASEFSDLQTIYTNCQSIFASTYVGYITSAYIKGNPYNAKWWGGATSTASVAALGDLTAGMSELNATRLVNKWFLGTDLPMPVAGGDTAKGLSATFIASYTTATGPLFVNGVAASDVNQGYAGTCYLDSTFGAVAKAKPDIITSAFTDNGNNTYGVRFYFDGKPVYTTIDKEVPVYNGTIAFVGNNTKSTSGELWTTLLEKAYAQLNAQFNLDGSNSKEASYQAIEGGLAYPIKQLTGLNYKYYTSYYQSIPDNMASGTYYSATSSTYKQTIINALNAGAVGWLGSWGATTGSNGKKEFVAGHAYMLLGYNSSTDKFTVRNPWGDSATGNYNAQFEVSIDTFWNSNVKGLVALSDSTTVDPSYTYNIASSAGTTLTAVSEGAPITFTITRSSSGTASIVYISTRAVTAGGSDYETQTKTAISFDANETTKTVSINTYTDSLTEGAEYFYVDLYDHYTDTTPQKTGIAYIKDAVAPSYTYTLTTAANTLATAVDEGGAITFTITRSSSGSASTVYVSSRAGTAGNSDYSALTKTEVAFAANETVKTVTVNTYTDSLVEAAEYLYLDLYKNYADTTASTSAYAYIKDKALPTYTYTLTSSASTSATAVTEGGVVHFTITRSSSGTSSTVYLSTATGTASGEDYLGVSKQALTFEANQFVLTFDVKTSTDWWLETPEYFNLNLYKTYSDTTAAATGIAYIKDAVVDPYNYSVTSSGSVAEGGQLTFKITRSTTGSASTVYVTTTPGSAGSADFTAFNKQAITFAANELQKTVTVDTYTDGLTEGTEYFNLDLFKNYSDAAYTTYATGYITDSTPAAYTYTVSSSTPYASPVTEGGSITFTITRSGSGTASTVYVSTTAGSAGGSDYDAITKQAVSFAAYQTSKTITIDTFTDSLSEGSEYFYLDLFKNYSDSTYSSYGTGYIKDPTAATSYTYTISTAANSGTYAVEEGGSVTFTITRSGSGSASTVYVSTAAGTAGDSDYDGLYKQAVSFAAYETTKTITVDTFTDSLTEGNEYFYLNLYKSYADSAYSSYNYAYLKDKVAAGYTYSVACANTYGNPATEGGAVTFTITRSGSGSASSVYVTTTTGSAGAADFNAFDKMEVDFAANETVKTVTVNTYTDSLTEGTEYFYLDLFKNYSDSTYSTYALAYLKDPVAATSYTYTIGSAAISSTNAVTEGSPVTFTITRSGSGAASTVYLSTFDGSAGSSDYQGIYKQAVSFAAYETTKTITIGTYTDSLTEVPEYFYVELYKNYSDASNSGYTWAYIRDAAAASYTYSISSAATLSTTAVGEGGSITFTITRSGSGSASTVYVSTSAGTAGGSDYESLYKQAVSFAANETTKTITIDTYTDGLTEGLEYFYVNLYKNYADTSYAAYGYAYIKDNVAASYTYSVASSTTSLTPVTEGGSITFTITRSGTGSASSVYVTTTSGSAGAADFDAFNKLEIDFAAYETTKTVTVNTYTDGLTEGTEYFYLDLFKNYSDDYYSTYGTGYINDVASASYNYTIATAANSSATAVAEGNSVTFTITRSGTGTASTVYVCSSDGSAVSSDYSSIYKQAVSFAANETTKTITINTYADSLTEAPEYFYVNLYKNYADTSYSSYAYAYIKDAAPSCSYSVSSTAGYSTPVTEGGAITFTITRNGTGSASTIYASTTAVTAGSSDYTAISKQAIYFGASETTKTITVYTTADSLTEATECFFLDLFKSSSDSLYSWYGTAYIKDPTTSTLAVAAASTSTLTGSAGADVITGSAAKEVLYGGGGADTLIGGGGADVFRYANAAEGGDTIVDFRAEEGATLAFVSANFGGLAVGNLQAANFASNATGAAVDANSRFLFNTSNGVLRYDADGTGSGAAVTIATLNTRSLHASNIMLVA